MNVFKIAWRSIQHRGIGSILTVVSMALGVMMVVAVLSIHGVVTKSFQSNNSFGYNMIVGARGGGLQLTLNSVYYLSQPVENIPYEYYLAFCDAEQRRDELRNSIAYEARTSITESMQVANELGLGGSAMAGMLAQSLSADMFDAQQDAAMGIQSDGLYRRYTHIAIPICLGDSYVHPPTDEAFRCVGTKPNFFTDLLLDSDTEEQFSFSAGRAFEEKNDKHGYFECVIGGTVARRCGLKVGDKIQATHGDPESASSHLHEQYYAIVGILDITGTPHDRAVFLNMEGFFLMEDHAKSVEDDSVLAQADEDEEDVPRAMPGDDVDPFSDDEDDTFENALKAKPPEGQEDESADEPVEVSEQSVAVMEEVDLKRIPLPIEQREVTSILVRTSLNDKANVLGLILPAQINEGDLERSLDWTPYRPVKSQKAAQAVNPVMQVTTLFDTFVNPTRWLLLGLTSMICVVSALSIVVGIYNSMNQRQHEIAVIRALGASRGKVMAIMLCEAILLAVAGGLLGWLAGHGLNLALSPVIEDRTGVAMGFFDLAPGLELGQLPGGYILPDSWQRANISSEVLLVPALIFLAILVGLYPAISAYRTDVSKALGK